MMMASIIKKSKSKKATGKRVRGKISDEERTMPMDEESEQQQAADQESNSEDIDIEDEEVSQQFEDHEQSLNEEEEENDDEDEDFATILKPSEDDEDEEDHEETLARLKDKDPEFYQFLLENDQKLLQFGEDGDDMDSGEEEEGDDFDEEEEQETEMSGKHHKIKVTKDKHGRVIINADLLEQWEDCLAKEPTKELCTSVIAGLRCGLQTIAAESTDATAATTTNSGKFVFRDHEHFNDLVNLCLGPHLLAALHKILKLPPPGDLSASSSQAEEDGDGGGGSARVASGPLFDPSRSKKWKGLQGPIKSYFTSILTLMDSMTDVKLILALLNHILNSIHFFVLYTPLMKKLLRHAIGIWSESTTTTTANGGGREELKILAFFIILRTLSRNPSKNMAVHSFILRKLYLAYVRASRSYNATTSSSFLFMRQSLVELYALDHAVAYQQCFVFLRQMAILLRSAIGNKSAAATAMGGGGGGGGRRPSRGKSTGAMKSVYSWSFVHSLILWQQLLVRLHPSDVLEPLLYPLVQIMLGTIKLYPSARHSPLHAHLLRALVRLSAVTNKFVPLLPQILRLLEAVDYKKIHKESKDKEKAAAAAAAATSKNKRKRKNEDSDDEEAVMMGSAMSGDKPTKKKSDKPIDFQFILRVPVDAVAQSPFHAELHRVARGLLLDYLTSQANRIAFPELVYLPGLRLRRLVKNCPSPAHAKELKRLLETIDKNGEHIARERRRRRGDIITMNNLAAIEDWEASLLFSDDQMSKSAQSALSVLPLVALAAEDHQKQGKRKLFDQKKQNPQGKDPHRSAKKTKKNRKKKNAERNKINN